MLYFITLQVAVLAMQSVTKEPALADVFAEDSENEQTFYGFSDSEISDHWDKVSNLTLIKAFILPESNWKNKH